MRKLLPLRHGFRPDTFSEEELLLAGLATSLHWARVGGASLVRFSATDELLPVSGLGQIHSCPSMGQPSPEHRQTLVRTLEKIWKQRNSAEQESVPFF